MKKSNFWKLLSGTVFFATVALASCVDDNDDKGMPYLEVTPDVLTFNADGAPEGASAFTVKSNRPWTLEVLEGSDWVTPSATQGSGDGTVEFTIPASNVGRIAKLSFNLKNAYGAYWTKEVTIEQGRGAQGRRGERAGGLHQEHVAEPRKRYRRAELQPKDDSRRDPRQQRGRQ